MRSTLALLVLLVACVGCCSTPATSAAAATAADSNVEAWRVVQTYVMLWGRQDGDEAKAATTLMLKRAQAFRAQALAIKAAIANDKSFDARKAYAEAGEVDVP